MPPVRPAPGGLVDNPKVTKPDSFVLSEGAAVEVLAYLITAARTQLDEAAEYAPLRLMTAARKLADAIGPRASEPVQRLIAVLDELPLTAVPRVDREAYTERIDALCRAVADCLLELVQSP